jgi:predicted transposase YdaD
MGGYYGMVKPWDDLMKRLFITSPQQMVQWLIPGAQFVSERTLELKSRTIVADILYNIVVHGKEMVLHVEFQRRNERTMGKRLWEYNALAVITSGLPVCSIVIYLKKVKRVVEPPYEMQLPDGGVSHVFFFRNVKLWEIPTEVFQQPGAEGLLPLLPLTRDGARREVVEEMILRLLSAQKSELLPLGYIVAALVFKKDNERDWLNRRYGMLRDILKESWAFQDILREGLAVGIEQGREQGREQGIEQGREQGIKKGM